MMLNANDIRQILRHRCEQAGSQQNWCILHDIKPTYVSAVLGGRLLPGRKLAKVLGYDKNVHYIACVNNEDVE
jgi:hypothetical protein